MRKMSRESDDRKVCAWLDEFDEDVEFEDSDDSDDSDTNLVLDLRTNNSENESENDDDFGDTDYNSSEYEFYLGKDGKTKWYKNFLTDKTERRARNIIITR